MTRISLKETVKAIPLLGPFLVKVKRSIFRNQGRFPGSRTYWDKRYKSGGSSGAGSAGDLARFKADFLNGFVGEHLISTVIEFGCGDGSQLRLARYPSYVGFDVSPRAVSLCRRLFAKDPTKTFKRLEKYRDERADLTLSLDVIFHLVEDDVFERHMHTLFDAALKHVIVYSSNTNSGEEPRASHERHREFTSWVECHKPGWKLIRGIPNRYPYTGDERTGSISEFFIYGRR
jgi:hypothetical protein